MSSLINEFVNRTQFDSYNDFKENFKIIAPENFNFGFDVVDRYAQDYPKKTAIIWCDDKGNEETFDFSYLKTYSNKAANFYKKAGIKKGDTVMLTLKSRYEFWINIIALHKLGAIVIPATHMLKTKDIVYRIQKGKVKMIVSINEHGLPDLYEEAEKELGYTVLKTMVGFDERKGWFNFNEEIFHASSKFERPTGDDTLKPEDSALIYFSSGTSGQPKMVEHNHYYGLGHIVTAYFWQNVQEDGLHYTGADTGWGKAVWGLLYGQWISGTAVFVYDYDRFNAENLMKKIEKYKITTFCAPPTIYRFLIKEDLTKYDLSSIKYAVTAGEPLNPEVFNKFKEATGLEIKEGFGQTETTLSIANFPWLPIKVGSMGKPSPLFDISLVDGDGNPVDVGEEGEIVINTENGKPIGLFQRYHLDSEKTKEAWHDGYYHTGDTAWKDEDGYLWFIGRTDDIIKSSGYRIGPFEVESAVISHPSVLECAITACPDEIRGSVVKATIVLTKGYVKSEELKKEIQNHVKNVTAPYKYPRIIEFVDELPKTISGKIIRADIRKKDSN